MNDVIAGNVSVARIEGAALWDVITSSIVCCE